MPWKYEEEFGDSWEFDSTTMITNWQPETIELTFDGNMVGEAVRRLIDPVNTFCKIKKVIFNDPATIVFWEDGAKTVVKCREGETFDKWTGLSMALAKRVYGDSFHHIFKELCDVKGE